MREKAHGATEGNCEGKRERREEKRGERTVREREKVFTLRKSGCGELGFQE